MSYRSYFWPTCHDTILKLDLKINLIVSELCCDCTQLQKYIYTVLCRFIETLPVIIELPIKVMIWGCMSVHGTTRFAVVEGSIRSDQYIRILQSSLLPQSRVWFPSNRFIFQQDLAPCHTSKLVKKWLADHGVQVLPWPGNSPDMNPIENFWPILKAKVQKRNVRT